MGVLEGGNVMSLGRGSRPEGEYVVGGVVSISFVECDEESGFLRLEDVAVKGQWDKFAEVVVSFGD